MHKFLQYSLAPLALWLLASCGRYDTDGYRFDNTVYLDISRTSQEQPATFGNNIPEVTRTFSALLAYPEETDVRVTVAPDEALVATYNRTHGTDFAMLPARYTDFKPVQMVIPAGKTFSESIPVHFIALTGEGESHEGAMDLDHTYLFPLRITSKDLGVMQGSAVAYFLVRRSSSITVAARLTDNWINFPLLDQPGRQSEAYNGLTAMTYEALIYVDKFDLNNSFGSCAISSVMGVEQYLLLRIGDTKFERQQLQFDGSGSGASFGKFPRRDPRKNLEAGRWYHVACTYDYETRTARIYVDGKIQSEAKEMGNATGGINLAQRALGEAEAYQFFIGRSYNEYRPLQGMIAEARVWNVARTPEQIWENMYRIREPENEPTLIGYWKFNDGSGNIIKDYSRTGNDGVAQKDVLWPDGVEIPEINKTEE